MYAAESASQAGTRSVCVIRAAVDKISTDVERHGVMSLHFVVSLNI